MLLGRDEIIGNVFLSASYEIICRVIRREFVEA